MANFNKGDWLRRPSNHDVGAGSAPFVEGCIFCIPLPAVYRERRGYPSSRPLGGTSLAVEFFGPGSVQSCADSPGESKDAQKICKFVLSFPLMIAPFAVGTPVLMCIISNHLFFLSFSTVAVVLMDIKILSTARNCYVLKASDYF